MQADHQDIIKSIENHPLAEQISEIASEYGIDLSDITSLPFILDALEGKQSANSVLIVTLSLMLERMVEESEKRSKPSSDGI